MEDLQQLNNEQDLLREKMERPAYYKHDECQLMQVRVFPLNKNEIFLAVRLGTLETKFNLSKENALDLADRLIYAAKYQA
jgi:hypothetical protein